MVCRLRNRISWYRIPCGHNILKVRVNNCETVTLLAFITISEVRKNGVLPLHHLHSPWFRGIGCLYAYQHHPLLHDGDHLYCICTTRWQLEYIGGAGYFTLLSDLKTAVCLPGSRARVRKSRYSGEMLQSPIHCCDVTKLSYLFSGEH